MSSSRNPNSKDDQPPVPMEIDSGSPAPTRQSPANGNPVVKNAFSNSQDRNIRPWDPLLPITFDFKRDKPENRPYEDALGLAIFGKMTKELEKSRVL